MEYRRLRYFIAIYESGSLTKAAEVCGVAQPALSQQLAVLEKSLNVQLFERSRQGLEPTIAAHKLYRRALVLVQQMNGLANAVSGPETADVVAVGLSATAALSFGLELVRLVKHQDPRIVLQIVENRGDELSRQVESGRLAFAVLPHRINPGLEHTLLATERLSCIAPSTWRLPATMTLSALGEVPMLLTCRPHSIRTLVDAAFAQAGLEPRVTAEIDSVPLLRDAVIAGMGASVLPATLFGAASRDKVSVSELQSDLYRTILLCARPACGFTSTERLVRGILSELVKERSAKAGD